MPSSNPNARLFECVPNFSEGRDASVLASFERAIGSVPATLVLDRTSDPDHHRSVITFAGNEDAVADSAVRAVQAAAAAIDLKRHRGIHPRVGALDVLPFVPLDGAPMGDAVRLAHLAGRRIVAELGIPVYFYGEAALRPERAALESVRRGQFEGLMDTAPLDPLRAPDLGGPALHPTAGAVIVGARKILIAFNINLATADLAVAQRIARRIRASSGGLLFVKALGLPLSSRNLVQVSMNLTNYEQTPFHVVYAEVARLAGHEGVAIAESELIGLIPQKALDLAAPTLPALVDCLSGSTIEARIVRALARGR